MSEQKFESWCIVELFGHQVIAGVVTEASIGGCAFVRVDVPDHDGHAAFTKFFGQGAIYSMTPGTEETARAAITRLEAKPIQTWMLEAPRQKPIADQFRDDLEDDEDGYDGGELKRP